MKTNLASMITTACFTAMILISCESHEQKADDAFEHVKEVKMASGDSGMVSKEIIQAAKETELVKKSENIDEWTKFKLETEKRITLNENKIKVLKAIPDANTKLNKKIAGLEEDNNDLRKQMDVYHEKVKMEWENFKVKINHDVNEIGIELKDISLNNRP